LYQPYSIIINCMVLSRRRLSPLLLFS